MSRVFPEFKWKHEMKGTKKSGGEALIILTERKTIYRSILFNELFFQVIKRRENWIFHSFRSGSGKFFISMLRRRSLMLSFSRGVGDYENIKSNFSFFVLWFVGFLRKDEATHKREKGGKLLCWLIDFSMLCCCFTNDGGGIWFLFCFIVSNFFPLSFIRRSIDIFRKTTDRQIGYWLVRGVFVCLLTSSGPRWRDLWQRTNAVDPVSCPAFRDNTPNDLVYPMPISSEPEWRPGGALCMSFRWSGAGTSDRRGEEEEQDEIVIRREKSSFK